MAVPVLPVLVGSLLVSLLLVLATLLWRHFGHTVLWNDLCDVIAAIWRYLNASLPKLAMPWVHR
jgi:hypothetical protein